MGIRLFLVVAVTHTADVSICLQVIVWTSVFISPGHTFKNCWVIWQFYDESFDQLAKCFLQCLYPFTFLPMVYGNSNFHIMYLSLSHPNRCAVSHSDSHVCFFNNQGCWIPFVSITVCAFSLESASLNCLLLNRTLMQSCEEFCACSGSKPLAADRCARFSHVMGSPLAFLMKAAEAQRWLSVTCCLSPAHLVFAFLTLWVSGMRNHWYRLGHWGFAQGLTLLLEFIVVALTFGALLGQFSYAFLFSNELLSLPNCLISILFLVF